MPETTYLHIEMHDSTSTKVLELSEPSVRIGRGAQCEVRLGQPTLAEVQCMLRRRGETWHLQPIGPPGRISIDGRPIEHQRSLPLGVSFRVGDCLLTIRSADALPDPEPDPLPDPVAENRPGTGPGSEEAERERLARWQARLEQRERWLQARQEERRWGARWKAAGQGLRSRSAASPTPTETPTPSPSPAPNPEPASPARSEPASPARSEPTGASTRWSDAMPIARVVRPNRPTPAPPSPPSPRRAVEPARPAVEPTSQPPKATNGTASPEVARVEPARPSNGSPRSAARPSVPRPRVPGIPLTRLFKPFTRPAPADSAGLRAPGPKRDPLPASPTPVIPPTRPARPPKVRPTPLAPSREVAAIPPEPTAAGGPSRGEEETLLKAREVPESSPNPSADASGITTELGLDEAVSPNLPAKWERSPVEDTIETEKAKEVGPPQLESGIEPAQLALPAPVRSGSESAAVPAVRSAPEVILASEEQAAEPRQPAELTPMAEGVVDVEWRPLDSASAPELREVNDDPRLETEPDRPTEEATPRGQSRGAWLWGRLATSARRSRPKEPRKGPQRQETAELPASPRSDESDSTPPDQPTPEPIRASTEPEPEVSSPADPSPILPVEEIAPADRANPVGGMVTHSGPVDAEWPSARAIFEAHRIRSRPPTPPPTATPTPTPTATPAQAPRSTARRPELTVGQAPVTWQVPGLVWVWVPTLVLTLAAGGLGLKLAWAQAQDARAAGQVADRVLRREPPLSREENLVLAEMELPGAVSWWSATAGNLYLRALATDRDVDDPDREERVRSLLDASRSAAPAQAEVRFALAQSASDRDEPSQGLGLSRDVVALAQVGRQLLESGKPDAALRAYATALDLAARADLARLDPPAFLDNREINRYALPYEHLMEPLIRDLADRGDWTFERWSAALPQVAVAPLVAARVLRNRESPEAEDALELALTLGAEPPPPGTSAAVQTAARAEALALRGDWEEAEAAYRQAIDLTQNDLCRRSWWMNLADLYLRLNDESRLHAAWEAAKGSDPDEEITHRAIDEQRRAGVGPESQSQTSMASDLMIP